MTSEVAGECVSPSLVPFLGRGLPGGGKVGFGESKRLGGESESEEGRETRGLETLQSDSTRFPWGWSLRSPSRGGRRVKGREWGPDDGSAESGRRSNRPPFPGRNRGSPPRVEG